MASESAWTADRERRRLLYGHLIVTGILFVFLFHRVLWWFWIQLIGEDEPWQIIFVPFLSGIILSQRLSQLRDSWLEKGSRWGLVLILLGMLLHILGIAVQSFPPSQVGMITIIQGIVLYAFGRSTYRLLFFPLAYLFLAIPLPPSFSVLLTGPLRVLSASVASRGLALLGVDVVHRGTILSFPSGTLSIVNACSGLQSMLTLCIMSLPIGYLTQKSFRGKTVIFLASIPLGLAANVLRVMAASLLFVRFGEKYAHGFPHTAIGMAIVLASFFLLYGLGLLISGSGKDRKMC